jgi:hypothetical protein
MSVKEENRSVIVYVPTKRGASWYWRGFKRFLRRYYKIARVWGAIALGSAMMVAGVPLALLPGHLGVPLVLIGLVLLLRNAMWARRHFIHLKRRHPNLIMPIRKLLRKNPPWVSVIWHQVLRTERLVMKLVKSRGFLAAFRRKVQKSGFTVA